MKLPKSSAKTENARSIEIAETVFEPREGGHVYDRGVERSECRWARVLAYEPPNWVVIIWDISPQWQLDPNSEAAIRSEISLANHS